VKYVNAFVYYLLAKDVHDLLVVEEGIRITPEVITVLSRAIDALQQFTEHDDQERFRSSIAEAKSLSGIVGTLIKLIADHASTDDGKAVRFTALVADAVKNAVRKFEILLEKDLHDLPLFCVQEQGNFSTERLIKGASAGHPQATRAKLAISQMNEIDEAGRCLAFARSTASGFHILRAMELLVRDYIARVGLPAPAANKYNWGEYIQILRTGGRPKEITDLLQMVKDNYRNPIMHPEDSLTAEEALSLFGICQSAIEVICRDMP